MNPLIRTGITEVSPTATCAFETSDLCGYTQDKDDDFDWSRHRGDTASFDTGPVDDHTYMSYSMYIVKLSPLFKRFFISQKQS